jgi:hypothetical protein
MTRLETLVSIQLQSINPCVLAAIRFAAAGHPSGGLGLGSATSAGTGLAASSSTTADVFEVRLGGLTDPGVPGKNNQDDFFVWDSGDGQNFVVGVLDGHGRDLGALAANTAKKSLLVNLSTNFDKIRVDPEATLKAAFVTAHKAVKNVSASYHEQLTESAFLATLSPATYNLKFPTSVTQWFHGCEWWCDLCASGLIVAALR